MDVAGLLAPDAAPPSGNGGPAHPGTGLSVEQAAQLCGNLITNIERVVRGRSAAVHLAVAAVLSGGHVLLEDVPGTGKTTLARALAKSVGGTFRRVQATSDLLPADITGAGVWQPATGEVVFAPGPAFANVLLIDELNRTPPRTQSALMEAMDEGAITADGVRHALPDPFLVVATQNPLDQHGTYPLPEGQLDRFAVTVTLGHTDHASERLVLREQLVRATVDDLGPVLSPAGLRAARGLVRHVHVSDAVLDHVLALVEATRASPEFRLGASSRAALSLLRLAQARALLRGSDHVLPDDIRALAPASLGHRVVLADTAAAGPGQDQRRRTAHARGAAAVARLAAALPVPVPR